MTNQETIEELNDALNNLIDAYENLQKKNNELTENLNKLIEKNKDLEFQLSDVNTTIDKRENKMDGMLNKIHKLLAPQKDNNQINDDVVSKKYEIDEKNNQNGDLFSNEDNEDDEDESIMDIQLDSDKQTADTKSNNTSKLDLGRMESLLNGLNNK